MSQPDHPDYPMQTAAALTAEIGRRVRALRAARGLSRRALSERSGVSERYLAQLEAGGGNISIVLLHRVASAFGLGAAALIGAADPLPEAARRVAEMYMAADEPARARALAALSGGASAPRRVCLVGLRGAGKSTLGALAGAALGAPFVELNQEIETLSGMPVSEVMALYGAEGYRRFEAEALTRVTAAHDEVILAAAGGVVEEPATYERLRADYRTIWLTAPAEEHMRRVRAQGDERPMAGDPQALSRLRDILDRRAALYGRADARLDTGGMSAEAAAEALAALIRSRGFLVAAHD